MNNMPKLDLSSLQKVSMSLHEALMEYKKNTNNSFVRDAVIQRFEYTYELSHKVLKRFLEISEPNSEEIDQMSFPMLIRTSFERGLVQNSWDVWKIYRNARNATSHTYNEAKASEICKIIPNFFNEADNLVRELQKQTN